MIVKCPSCTFNGNVSDSKIPLTGISMKCPKCSNIFKIERPPVAIVEEDSEDKCPKCEAVKVDKVSCAKCGLVFAKYRKHIIAEEPEPETHKSEAHKSEAPSYPENVKLVSSVNNGSTIKIAGIAVLVTFLVALIILAIFASRDWEYKVVTLTSDLSRSGQDAFDVSTLVPSDESLNAHGKEGWELVSTHLEMETAHPNYGNDEYVSGLQPNVRPQRLVIVFKRRTPFF